MENRIRYLIELSLQQKETEAEREELDSYLTDESYEEIVQKILLDSFYQKKEWTDMEEKKQEDILAKIHSLDEPKVLKIKKVLGVGKWVAAAILLMILAPFWLNHEKGNKEEDVVYSIQEKEIPEETGSNERVETIMQADHNPPEEKAMLTFSNGESVSLETIPEGQKINKEGMSIEKVRDGSLRISFNESQATNKPQENTMHSISTPRGGTYEVVLSEGTKVFLNSASVLTFPAHFGATHRKVQFEGEGYFQVAKDKNRQFIVVSGQKALKQEVHVYGTEFNLKSYPGEDKIVTTLVEGSIKIKDVQNAKEHFLKPLEESAVDKKGLQIRQADMEASLAWKNNIFYFADEPLRSVMNQICRWYDVDIKYVGVEPDARIWAQISRTKTLSHILEALQKSNGLQFEIRGKELIVKP